MIKAAKIDNIWMHIECSDDGTLMELRDYFSFKVPGYQFKRSHMDGWWDGTIKLFNAQTQRLYVGLLPYLKEFCQLFNYPLEIDKTLFTEEVMSPTAVRDWVATIPIYKKGKPIKPRYYQMVAVYNMINAKRGVYVAPTAAGKSLMIYLFSLWFFHNVGGRVLLVVPTTGLVEQMASDFDEYSQGTFSHHVHKIYAGKMKDAPEKSLYVTTWQSIYDMKKIPPGYFDQFDAVIIDECHGAQAKSLKGILENCNAEFRQGLTGTMHEPEAHKWVIEGLLGEVVDLISMQELMERGWVSNLKINCVVFDHDKETKAEAAGLDYHAEIKYLINHKKRNAKIFKAIGSVKENSFVLFDKVDYGEWLYKTAEKLFPDRKVYLVYGATTPEERETIRKALEGEEGSIVIASYKVFSTGISIDNLHHIFFAEPVGKSKFRIFQSIGRSLRLHSEKEFAYLWDFVDKLTNNKSKLNHTMRHFVERVQHYNTQGLQYKITSVDL